MTSQMQDLKDEIRQAFEKFEPAWQGELSGVIRNLARSDADYFESYLELVSLNAWRKDLLSTTISSDSVSFFLEAQNDGLVSHVFARMGAWRSALKSLRSCMEDMVLCLYFKDHPVELSLWNSGKFKPGFSSTIEYLRRHPLIDGIEHSLTGIDILEKEYSTLSRAVHGSAQFQMTGGTGGSTSLWTDDVTSLGKWRTREHLVLQSINLLLLTIFRENLQGTQRPQLRRAISFAVSPSKIPAIKAKLGITLTPPK